MIDCDFTNMKLLSLYLAEDDESSDLGSFVVCSSEDTGVSTTIKFIF